MDRFIEIDIDIIRTYISSLKSNMDRFIAIASGQNKIMIKSLKSNMDRFIAVSAYESIQPSVFKIQYGQIYSLEHSIILLMFSVFKIQYGQIYRFLSL